MPLLCLLLALPGGLLLPAGARGGDFRWLPEIHLRGEYDDNVTFDNDHIKSDYVGTCSPKVTFSYLTEKSQIDGTLGVDILRYADETDLNTEYQNYRVKGSRQVTEKLALDAKASFIKDTTLESELRETGLVNYRENRYRYNVGGGATYQLNELSSLALNYTYSKTNYHGDENIDYDAHTVVGQFNRLLASQRDVVTLQPYYNYYDSSVSTVNNYGCQLGWNHRFSETLEFTAFGGARYTHTRYDQWERWRLPGPYPIYILVKERETDGNWGGVADVTVKKTGELWWGTLEYSHDLSYGSNGETLKHDRFSCRAGYRLTPRLRASLSAAFSWSKSDDEYSDEDSEYYHLQPGLSYNLTENHRLGLSYRYAHVYDKTLRHDQKYDRNRVWLTLTFRFPER
ncbi:MAG: outer membrane beta-barrel protein [Deltaproteobacteria bacterium]|nr:outer membrane beta-barrel protein [Deltaproteobacteria bacterium]